jgi:hypothetical protein
MTRLSLIAAAVLAATAVGCTKTQSTPRVYAGCVTYEKQAGSPQVGSVQVMSPDIAKIIGVLDVNLSRTGAGLAAIQTTVYNCTDVDVVLLMRTRFSGDRGQSEAPTAWKTVHLAPRAQAVYGDSASSAQTKMMAVDISHTRPPRGGRGCRPEQHP